jgi:hypothetical protein
MASNVLNNKWLRPVLALCALAGLVALGGCGGGSGAPNNPFAPVPPAPGPLFLLPPTAVVYSHTAATLQISGGAAPYSVFSSNPTVLPVSQNVTAAVVVLIPSDVAADTAVIVTVQDAIGQTATTAVTVRPAPLFNTLTIVPSRTACGTNAVCSGDTATATVQVTAPGGAGIPNRQVLFEVLAGQFAIQTTNPALPLVASFTVVSDANGNARVILQAGVNVPTQPAELRATDLTTGNSVTAAFTIVQQTDGSAILSVVPADATITGPDKVTCSTGARVDYFIYGGTPPYHVSSTFPDAVTLVNSTVASSGGSFEAITNGTCVKPLTFTIVDAIGRQTTALLENVVGTADAPPPPTGPVQVTPATGACISASQGFTITGGTPPYNVSSPFGTVFPGTVPASPGSFTFIFGPPTTPPDPPVSGIFTIFVGDTSVPQKTFNVTIKCP